MLSLGLRTLGTSVIATSALALVALTVVLILLLALSVWRYDLARRMARCIIVSEGSAHGLKAFTLSAKDLFELAQVFVSALIINGCRSILCAGTKTLL